MTHRPLPPGARVAAPCPVCRTPKPVRFYLCTSCWRLLPAQTRRALNRSDDLVLARVRLRELRNHVECGLPLAELEITP